MSHHQIGHLVGHFACACGRLVVAGLQRDGPIRAAGIDVLQQPNEQYFLVINLSCVTANNFNASC